MTISVRVNGAEATVAAGSTVAELVVSQGAGAVAGRGGRGVAVAVNGEVVPRSEWERTVLRPSDRVELLNAVGGG